MKFRAKSAEAFLRNQEFCKKSRFYPIPMGFTTVTHILCINGPKSLISPNIICLNNGKIKFYSWIQKLFSGNQLQTTTKKTFRIWLSYLMVWQYFSNHTISLIPIEVISKTVREVEHHWLGQADAELQICLLLLQKNFGGKFSAEKVEQIIHNILCDLLLTGVQVSSTLINIKPKLCLINMINMS